MQPCPCTARVPASPYFLLGSPCSVDLWLCSVPLAPFIWLRLFLFGARLLLFPGGGGSTTWSDHSAQGAQHRFVAFALEFCSPLLAVVRPSGLIIRPSVCSIALFAFVLDFCWPLGSVGSMIISSRCSNALLELVLESGSTAWSNLSTHRTQRRFVIFCVGYLWSLGGRLLQTEKFPFVLGGVAYTPMGQAAIPSAVCTACKTS